MFQMDSSPLLDLISLGIRKENWMCLISAQYMRSPYDKGLLLLNVFTAASCWKRYTSISLARLSQNIDRSKSTGQRKKRFVYVLKHTKNHHKTKSPGHHGRPPPPPAQKKKPNSSLTTYNLHQCASDPSTKQLCLTWSCKRTHICKD